MHNINQQSDKLKNNQNYQNQLNSHSSLLDKKVQNQLLLTNDFNYKNIMMELTMARLRKMQALVRGFIVRRRIYPQELTKYTMANSILFSVMNRIVRKESSKLVMESVTFPKYEQNGIQEYMGKQVQVEEEILNNLLQKIINKECQPIIQQVIVQKALSRNQPLITFGLNLRNPLQLLLYETIIKQIKKQVSEISEESVKQNVIQYRQIRVIQNWIDKYDMIEEICSQILDESLLQNECTSITNNILNRLIIECSTVLSKVCISQENKQIQQNKLQILQNKLEQWLIQSSIMKILLDSNHEL